MASGYTIVYVLLLLFVATCEGSVHGLTSCEDAAASMREFNDSYLLENLLVLDIGREMGCDMQMTECRNRFYCAFRGSHSTAEIAEKMGIPEHTVYHYSNVFHYATVGIYGGLGQMINYLGDMSRLEVAVKEVMLEEAVKEGANATNYPNFPLDTTYEEMGQFFTELQRAFGRRVLENSVSWFDFVKDPNLLARVITDSRNINQLQREIGVRKFRDINNHNQMQITAMTDQDIEKTLGDILDVLLPAGLLPMPPPTLSEVPEEPVVPEKCQEIYVLLNEYLELERQPIGSIFFFSRVKLQQYLDKSILNPADRVFVACALSDVTSVRDLLKMTVLSSHAHLQTLERWIQSGLLARNLKSIKDKADLLLEIDSNLETTGFPTEPPVKNMSPDDLRDLFRRLDNVSTHATFLGLADPMSVTILSMTGQFSQDIDRVVRAYLESESRVDVAIAISPTLLDVMKNFRYWPMLIQMVRGIPQLVAWTENLIRLLGLGVY